MPFARTLLLLALAQTALVGAVHAQTAKAMPLWAEGLRFEHQDWELACDNTGTCRAAGYSRDDDPQAAMSVLLTRRAGAGESVQGELMLGSLGLDGTPPSLPTHVTLRVNGRDLGRVVVDGEGHGTLSAPQLQALLAALPQNDPKVTWLGRSSKQSWTLSDRGAAAVLLKMDDYQGHLGTPGALVRRGSRPEQHVPPARPAPVVHTQLLPEQQLQPVPAAVQGELRRALQSALKNPDDCELQRESDPPELSYRTLPGQRWLVAGACWRAAYNSGTGYWITQQKAPYGARLVTTDASDYEGSAVIDSVQKGRGIGDCFSLTRRVWDGQGFVLAETSTTGACRLVKAGGTWSMPTYTTRVLPVKR